MIASDLDNIAESVTVKTIYLAHDHLVISANLNLIDEVSRWVRGFPKNCKNKTHTHKKNYRFGRLAEVCSRHMWQGTLSLLPENVNSAVALTS